MADVVFLGGEAEAAGWRLAGVRALPAPDIADRLAETWDVEAAGARLLLIDAATAARLPADRLAWARAAGRPQVCVLPAADAVPAAVVSEARRLLGLDAS